MQILTQIGCYIQGRPTKSMQWGLTGAFALYFLTFINEFRYINIKPAVKITDRRDDDGWTTQGDIDFVESHCTAPCSQRCQCSMNSRVAGFGSPVSGGTTLMI